MGIPCSTPKAHPRSGKKLPPTPPVLSAETTPSSVTVTQPQPHTEAPTEPQVAFVQASNQDQAQAQAQDQAQAPAPAAAQCQCQCQCCSCPPPTTSKPFVTASKGQLFLATSPTPTPFRFASLNAPELFDNEEFEVRDTMRSAGGFGRKVLRTYTLKVKSINQGTGHVMGWDSKKMDWIYDEASFVRVDRVLALADEYDVRLIVPIINQDYGSESTNWVGNFTDLVRMRKGISDYQTARKVDWWSDADMIAAFKLLISKLLNRVNTINGKRYGDDPSILAWQTGNEMNKSGNQPAPPSWTISICKYIKSLAPKTLTFDGSFARNADVAACYPLEILNSSEGVVDIVGYHFYGGGDGKRVPNDINYVKKFGKVFIADEYGFFSTAAEYGDFLTRVEQNGGQGSLVWSLRPHSSKGGFKTHGEGNGIYSYHVPGWSPVRDSEFDRLESQVISSIRQASYRINGEPIPSYPTPPPVPNIWSVSSGGKRAMSWQGAAWSYTYEVWYRLGGGTGDWLKMAGGILDNVRAGSLVWILPDQFQYGSQVEVRVRGVGVDGQAGGFGDRTLVFTAR